jgi:hypothetical protein
MIMGSSSAHLRTLGGFVKAHQLGDNLVDLLSKSAQGHLVRLAKRSGKTRNCVNATSVHLPSLPRSAAE